MNGKIYLYILVCAAVSFLIRELPLTLIRRPIKSRFLRSFLFYVPYVTLAVSFSGQSPREARKYCPSRRAASPAGTVRRRRPALLSDCAGAR